MIGLSTCIEISASAIVQILLFAVLPRYNTLAKSHR